MMFTSPGSDLRLGPLTLRWYGLLIALAVLIGLKLSQTLAKRRHVKPDVITDLAIWLVLGAIPAARLYYVLFQWDYYRQNPSQIIAIWQGGIAIHGAILGGMLATWLFCRIYRHSFWGMADLLAPSLILGQAIGRWGNFFNSEAFGRPTDLPWKLLIPSGHRPPGLADVAYYHPTFLYESLWNLLVLGLLLLLFFRFPQAKRGTLFLVYGVAYSAGRFWIEGLRMDSLMLGPLRVAQLVSVGGIILGLLGLGWLYLLQHRLPDVGTVKE
ncbi:prolipoprotein diacylglyceryl transferase [Synechococcales cyanobacterium C]|uniref:Phosphatidylglycerol--prolipoprotein diacylglyceryl transferase n=2 Tax=Petrachloros TaxID=2918834 RepID=A0A8K1ZZT6_9CYAN|nr:prolipoprotein diacylglyceryl transferase [Petrachloros mirabilis]NCJ08189.1 prolipoprotein diacylglyceryl transferase [Petrachloros mirabilis ULC683]